MTCIKLRLAILIPYFLVATCTYLHCVVRACVRVCQLHDAALVAEAQSYVSCMRL